MNFFFVLLVIAVVDIFFADRFRVPALAGFSKKCMGVLIGAFQKLPLQSDRAQKIGGMVFMFFVSLVSFAVMWVLLFYASKLHWVLEFVLELIFVYHLIGVRSFSKRILANKQRRNAQTLILQTLLHFTNYCIAPLLYIVLGGVPLALMCRAIQYCATTDFSVAQKEQFFIKFDKFLHFIPSYVLVLAVFSASAFLPFCNIPHAWHIFLRDRKKLTPHWKSRVIAICAGDLGIQLSIISSTGDNPSERHLIGEPIYHLTAEYVKMNLYLMYAASALVLFFCLIFTAAFGWQIL